jgi:hypothetical protein
MEMTALWQRTVAFRNQRAAWLVLAAALAFNFDCSLILKARSATVSPCWDTELAGCFQHIRGREDGLMIVRQEDCNVVRGHAQGLTELGPPANDVWVFNGTLEEEEEGGVAEGVAGVADFEASWDGAEDMQTLHAIHHAASDTEAESLTLTHLGTGSQVELVRCGP